MARRIDYFELVLNLTGEKERKEERKREGKTKEKGGKSKRKRKGENKGKGKNKKKGKEMEKRGRKETKKKKRKMQHKKIPMSGKRKFNSAFCAKKKPKPCAGIQPYLLCSCIFQTAALKPALFWLYRAA